MRDFVAIGDTVVDAFIRIKEAKTSEDNSTLSLAFGEKVPYESVEVVPAVGNSANASVAAARLGLSSALVSNLGADEHGEACLTRFKEESVDTEFISIEKGRETNYHYVLWYGNDRTILVKHQEYSRTFPDIGEPKWVYLSSLGGDTLEYHHAIASYLAKHPSVQLAFQPGTFQIKLSNELKEIYARSSILFCNVQEAERILGLDTLGTQELLRRLQAFGPKTAVITDGPRGAYAYDGTTMYKQLPYPDPKPPFERTGAGDAFASTVVAALALGQDLPRALEWGAINSMSVVQQVGAQKGLLSREKIEEYLKKAPAEFKTQSL